MLADGLADFFLARCEAYASKYEPREFYGEHYYADAEIDPMYVYETDTMRNPAVRNGHAIARRLSAEGESFKIEKSEILSAMWVAAKREVKTYMPLPNAS